MREIDKIESKLARWANEERPEEREGLAMEVISSLYACVLALTNRPFGYAHQPGEPTDVVTLRDRFAMAALTGILSGNEDMELFSDEDLEPFGGDVALAMTARMTEVAYKYADAALKAREKDGAQ